MATPHHVQRPWPTVSFDARTQGAARCVERPRWALRGRRPATTVATAIAQLRRHINLTPRAPCGPRSDSWNGWLSQGRARETAPDAGSRRWHDVTCPQGSPTPVAGSVSVTANQRVLAWLGRQSCEQEGGEPCAFESSSSQRSPRWRFRPRRPLSHTRPSTIATMPTCASLAPGAFR